MRRNRTSTDYRSIGRSTGRRRFAKAPAVWATGLLAAASIVMWPSDDAAATPVPKPDWKACGGGFQCANARVPLDHRRPRGTTIRVALIRHPATDPAHRIGSLFVNGGGPGEQLLPLRTDYARIPATWRARYDVVGFDPRGFGYSTAVRCFPTMQAEQNFLAALPPIPETAAQIRTWDRTWAQVAARCARRSGPLLRHDSTADVARDMDLLRRAVGDPVLNYVGISYGTGLGAVYANLFPGNVGRMILDGNVDPVPWTRGGGLPMFMRTGADRASAATLGAFLDLCGQAPTCAFSAGTPAATRARYAALLRRLRVHPVPVGTPPDGFLCDDVCAAAGIPLGQVGEWTHAAAQLQQLWTASATGRRATATPGSPPGTPTAPYTGAEQHYAVLCSDSANPRDPRAYTRAARLAAARSGQVGLSWAWATEPCATWPVGEDAYTGPWNRRTAATILMVGVTGDPATSYQSSVAMSHDLARARLLTVHGYGHTEFANPSTCATDHETAYLVTGALPAPGTVCEQDLSPFS